MKHRRTHKINTRLQVLALAIIIINVLFNYIYPFILPGAQTMKQVSDQYENLFTPAGYVFSIWGVIYLSFIVYGISQFIPGQKGRSVHYILGWPMVIANVLAMAWVTAFSYHMIGLSVMIIITMLMTAAVMFVRIKRVKQQSFWLGFPFSIFFGWITVAVIANVTVWLVANGKSGGVIAGPALSAVAMVFVAVALAIWICFTFRDVVYPAVIVWAAVGIGAADLGVNRSVAYVAFALAGLLAAILIVMLVNGLPQAGQKKLSPQQGR